jgi:hypothetical protein
MEDRGFLQRLAFKGGTAIRKLYLGNQGRFSLDLDFFIRLLSPHWTCTKLSARKSGLLYNEAGYVIFTTFTNFPASVLTARSYAG